MIHEGKKCGSARDFKCCQSHYERENSDWKSYFTHNQTQGVVELAICGALKQAPNGVVTGTLLGFSASLLPGMWSGDTYHSAAVRIMWDDAQSKPYRVLNGACSCCLCSIAPKVSAS